MTDDSRKYWVCCPMCDLDKCVKGSDKCEAEIWAKKEKERHMTDKEAINQLKQTAWLGTDANREKTEKAVEIAIKAIEDNAKLKEAVGKIRAEIVELQKEYQEYGWAYDDALEIINKHTEGLV